MMGNEPSSAQQLPDLKGIFGQEGILARSLPGYEFRPSQLQMAEGVLEAIVNGGLLCVEAGTGTGKTLAYLIPSLFSRKRVMVSTATRNLQDQIFFKDIPFIRDHIFPGLSATYMKGRQNYLCLKKFHETSGKPSLLAEAGAEREALAQWLQETESGDRAELSWLRDDDPLWRRLDARSDTCTGQRCSFYEECFITRMRQRALEADIIVVNHALFFSNLALQSDEVGRILPDFSVLVLDEAHEVEDIASMHFGRQLSSHQIDELCRDFLQELGEEPQWRNRLGELQVRAASFFASFPVGEGRYSLTSFRTPGGETVDLRDSLTGPVTRLLDLMRSLGEELLERGSESAEVDKLMGRLEHLLELLFEVFHDEDPERVYWFERRGNGVFLYMTPIRVAGLLRDSLFSRTDSVVLTSATLTTDHTFDYLRERLGLEEPEELIVPGEFDYASQALMYIPRDFPEPRSPGFTQRALAEIERIVQITDGHAFILFTSFQQMDRVYQALQQRLPFPVLRQGDMPKGALLERFKVTPHAVLCATSSFWQGVDVRGDALRAVIIDKLPFRVPTEPLVAARIQALQKGGENAFFSYSVPDAVITLKQGLGRLIRSRDDRGILTLFDSRIWRRGYGRIFLSSLPKCPVTDNIEDLKNFFD